MDGVEKPKLENQVEHGADSIKTSPAISIIYAIAPFLSILTIVLLWFLGSGNNSIVFPTPVMVFKKLWEMCINPISGSTLLQHILISMRRVFIALVCAIGFGVPFGVLMGWSKTFRSTFGTIFECIRPIPVLAWIPLMIMWFGIGEKAKIIMIFIGSVMPIVVNSYTGIKLVSPLYLDVGRMFNASSQWQLLSRIVFPAALPTIFAGIRNATSVAWMVVLASEMLAAKSGLGFLICRGMEVFDTSLVMAGMIAIAVSGALLSFITSFIERKICPWNRGIQSE